MKISFIVILVFFGIQLFGQSSSICGSIKDKTSSVELPYSSVLLVSKSDSLYQKGMMTDEAGNFCFEKIPFATYLLKVSYMGYQGSTQEIEVYKNRHYTEIELQKKSFQLEDVEVIAQKEEVEETIEKTTVNVEKNETTSGGNALDVMLSLPSVDLDVNGNIKYRGSNRVTILINGKASELVKNLEQIPADQIEKVEIINNPSSKYEADGMSGIINIIMKSANADLSGTSMRAYLGTPETYGGSVGYYQNSRKTSLFANSSYNRKTQFQTKEHWRDNYEDANALDYYQYDRQDQNLNNFMVNAGLNYIINEKQDIGVSLMGSSKLNVADRSIDYKSRNKQNSLIHHSVKDIEIGLLNYVVEGKLDYNYHFSKTQLLNAYFSYNYLTQNQNMEFDFYPVGSSDYVDHTYQNTDSDQLNKTADLSLDYSWNISDSSLWESGFRYTREDLLNDFSSETYNFETESWIPDTALANEFHYLQNMCALYVNYERQLKYFNLQVGLRGEYTTTNQFIKEEEDYVDLFPSLMLSKKLDKHLSIFGFYNRRINRPILKMINPYTNEYADVLNMHIGNPDLKPEYVNSFEFGSQYSAKKASAKIAVYYRHIDQAISRVKSATNDSALLVTFMNLDQAQLLGGEFNFSLDAFKWWQINANANVFYTTLVGEYGPNKIDKSHTGWTGTMNHQFKLPWKLQMQWYFYYKSPLPDVLGNYIERYYTDFALSKKVMKNKGKLIFKISDVFNTYRYGLDLVGLDESDHHYSQINRRKNQSQYFILSFVYNFKAKDKKKKENFFLEGFGK